MSTTTDTGPVYQEEPIKLETPSGLWGPQLAGPPQYWLSGSFFGVVPSDILPLPPRCRGLWVGGAGNLVVKGATNQNAAAVTLVAVQAGTFIPGRFAAVMATLTTATLIVAFCD